MTTGRPDKKGGGLTACAAAVILFPLLYFASLGPALNLRHRGVITQDALVLAYTPLLWAADKYEPIKNMIVWYSEFWIN